MKKYVFMALIFYLPLQLKLPNWPHFPVINIFAVLLLGIFLSGRNDRFVKPVFETPVIVFLLVWLTSFIYACIFTDGMPRIEIAREFKRLYLLPFIYFVMSRTIKDRNELKWLFWTFLACLTLCGQNTYYNGVLAGANFALHKRSSGPFGWGWQASDIAGGFLATFTPVLISYFFFVRKPLFKLGSAIGVGLCGLGVLCTYSRGSMMALLFACVGLIIVGGRDLARASKINFLVILIGLIMGGVMWKAWVPQSIIARVEGTIVADEEERQYMDSAFTDSDTGESNLDLSSQLRMHAWRQGLSFFYTHPLTGIGFRQVQYQLGHDPHNGFVLIGGEMGIVGILTFAWLILAVTRQGFQLMGTEFNYLGVGAVGMMIGFTTVNMFYSNFFRDTVVGSFWIMLAFLAVANSFVRQEGASGSDGSGEPAEKKMTYAEYRKRYFQSIVLALAATGILTAAMFSRPPEHTGVAAVSGAAPASPVGNPGKELIAG
ncbi:MAG: O-antigen ligase family protein [Candidatus Omnitrophica bacterium]|nr:O-antigen ligase family protein [Candidatus Omnitrophota bacterium]